MVADGEFKQKRVVQMITVPVTDVAGVLFERLWPEAA